jgi:urea transporter
VKIDSEAALLRQIMVQNVAILGIAALGSLAWGSWPITLGVLSGGLIAIGCYYWLQKTVRMIVASPGQRSVKKYEWQFGFRIIALGLSLFLVIAVFKVNVIALCCGLSVVLVSILIAVLRFAI